MDESVPVRIKPFLRADFRGRCAYSERTEEYLGGEEAFEVEHSKPKSKFQEILSAYHNLYYSCRGCNGHKSETWPPEGRVARGQRFADPCAEDPYVHRLREREDGDVEELTECGRYSNSHVRLGRSGLRNWRRLRSEARPDLPKRAAGVRLLAQVIGAGEGPGRHDATQLLAALTDRIEESKRRFAIE